MPQCSFCLQAITDAAAERCPHCGAWLSQGNSAAKSNPESLAATVRSLLVQGRKIEAIRIFREQTGFGLAEAKDAVERLERGGNVEASAPVTGDLDQQVLELLKANRKIPAIKLYREQTGLGLKEAKDAVESLGAQHGFMPAPATGCRNVTLLLLIVIAGGLLAWLSKR